MSSKSDAGVLGEVLYEVEGPVALITLNRPRYHNAQSWKLLDELDIALDRAMDDLEVKVVVLRGAGNDFSSGHDLGTPEHLADQEARGVADRRGLRFYEAFRKYNLDLTHKWRNLPKPTIAMVQGYCIFGGWMIAAAMDLVFASPDARFLAGLVEYFSIPYDIHPRKAKELIFESRFINAEEARDLGFVNRVLSSEDLERETLAYAHRVAENGLTLLRMAKLAINKVQDEQGFSSAMEGAFADFLVLTSTGGDGRKQGERRLGPVDLALRHARGDRHGLKGE
ncbi:MAG TPA: enoyl-CoA hydratase [Myxococcales bacterium]|jgi:enoyl-CoA hydratase|nr:enoyl-CoA hydratase [Myxococcales bacterium]HIL81414.1 enoyl-CoA hydratase [Myxococcales bacterium]